MSYQVLARKWRPRTFAELVGQSHVVTPLTNALKLERVHHAFLFSGTRGVGKTTIARVFAKALNCETGVTAEPCGVCAACREIDEGRFVDLIEVDAASRTKVDDTRELLDNVPYAPTRGRYKVYLIDEVHMLSNHSFNALLKTLEEPPPHVKFLLATTDPQKLPVTVLSRCLQFNLKRLPIEAISSHLEKILTSETINYEPGALTLIAAAAEGSVRDSLSLLDQAIAFSGDKILAEDVRSMLGTISHDYVIDLLNALVVADAGKLLDIVATIIEQGSDANAVLAEMITSLHLLALLQAHPQMADERLATREQLADLADKLSPEDIQLYYQIAVVARRDLPYVPDARSGLEMTLLRMLAFKPSIASAGKSFVAAAPTAATKPKLASQSAPATVRPAPRSAAAALAAAQSGANQPKKPKAAAHAAKCTAPEEVAATQPNEPARPNGVSPLTDSVFDNPVDLSSDPWETIIESLGVEALVRELAVNSELQSQDNHCFKLCLSETQPHLKNERFEQRLEQALQQRFGGEAKLIVELGKANNTPAAKAKARYDKRVEKARTALENDATVQQIKEVFGAEMLVDTVRPVD